MKSLHEVRERESVRQTSWTLDLLAVDDDPAVFIGELQAALDAVPVEFRETAKLDVRIDEMFGSEISLSYLRPETDREMAERIARYERAWKRKESEDREEYARLKAKYGEA